MPIQHASDRQLKLMARHYNQKTLYSLLNKIKEKIPDVSLRTTVLVGFPGETHEDFEELMTLIQTIPFNHLGGFIFSPEEDTPAEKITAERVNESEARLRLDSITEYQEDLCLERNEGLIGKTIRIIIDEVAEESEFHFYGRTEGSALDTDDIVKVIEGDAQVGHFYNAQVVDATPHELICKIL
jgi:ribosomal protein S12 methylthiotransferase